jgi:hypothetical protein
MKKDSWFVAFLGGLLCLPISSGADELLSSTEAIREDIAAEYPMRPGPTVEEVLSGELDASRKKSVAPPLTYEGEGYDESRLSVVPEPGVHPRVLMSPSDIGRIRKIIEMGDAAPKRFKKYYRQLKSEAAMVVEDPAREPPPWFYPSDYGWPVGSKAFLALLTQDEDLGREAAELVTAHARLFNERVEAWHRDAVWPDNIYNMKNGSNPLAFSLGLEYDYAYEFMTPEQRDEVRSVISKATNGHMIAFMELPDHYLINNHLAFSMNWYVMALAIEGEEGFDPRIEEIGAQKVRAYMTHAISPDGAAFEQQKPMVNRFALLATARRHRNLLKHDHLLAMARENAINSLWWYERIPDPPGESKERYRDEPETSRWRATRSGLHVNCNEVWPCPADELKYFYPDDPVIDLAWRIIRPHEEHRSLDQILLTVSMEDLDGVESDEIREDPNLPDLVSDLPMTWTDLHHGYVRTRTGWDRDSTVVLFENRSDYFSAGHEVSQHNSFWFASHGVPWAPYEWRSRYGDARTHNMILIDGDSAPRWQPVPGEIIGVYDTELATSVVGDATDAYNWQKKEKLFELNHPMLIQVPGNEWLRENGWKINRWYELPFHPQMRVQYEGYAHPEWGHWHGETRGPERYMQYNTVERVVRTMHLARGEHPYMLVIDDVRKDDRPHNFQWLMWLHDSVGLVATEGDDMIFAREGDLARLLVRVLHRNTGALPLPPSFTEHRIVIDSFAVEPDFHILIYPHNEGDPLPTTSWSENRTRLTVGLGSQNDVYEFGEAEGGRTVFAQSRNGGQVHSAGGLPPTPRLADIESWYGVDSGYGGHAYSVPHDLRANVFPFFQSTILAFEKPAAGQTIRYTTDGTEPDVDSPVYSEPVEIAVATVVRAKTFADEWPYGKGESSIIAAEFVPQSALASAETEDDSLETGLWCELYESYVTIYDREDGYFSGNKDMLPELTDRMAVLHTVTESFDPPTFASENDPRLQVNGYFVYRGYVEVPETGLYRFRLHSPGPVELRLGDRLVISHHGPYYLSQRDRYGAVVLEAGLHRLALTVCDPVLWKGDRVMTEERGEMIQADPPMRVEMALRGPGDIDYRPVPERALFRNRARLQEAGRGDD